MHSEKDISGLILTGQLSSQSDDDDQQVINVYELTADLPKDDKKREICLKHLHEGRDSELMIDFIVGGVHYPEATEPQEITTQLSCKGVGCILKKCGLKLEQFESTGKKIEVIKAS